MRYYIRHDENAAVEGPFTIEALTEAIRAGRIAPSAFASSDLGEGTTNLQTWRNCDWFPLGAIAQLRGVVPAAPEPTLEPRRLTAMEVMMYCVVGLCASFEAFKAHRWLMVALAVVAAVDLIRQLVHQRQKQSSAA